MPTHVRQQASGPREPGFFRKAVRGGSGAVKEKAIVGKEDVGKEEKVKNRHAQTTCACGSKVAMFMSGDPETARKSVGKDTLWVDGRTDRVTCPACGQVLAER